jgi:hypothetical protein
MLFLKVMFHTKGLFTIRKINMQQDHFRSRVAVVETG